MIYQLRPIIKVRLMTKTKTLKDRRSLRSHAKTLL